MKKDTAEIVLHQTNVIVVFKGSAMNVKQRSYVKERVQGNSVVNALRESYVRIVPSVIRVLVQQ